MNPTNFDRDRQDGDVKAEGEQTIVDETEGCELTKLGETVDSTDGTQAEHGDFDGVISDDSNADARDALDDEIVSGRDRLTRSSEGVGSKEGRTDDSVSQDVGFVETDGDDQEGECLGE